MKILLINPSFVLNSRSTASFGGKTAPINLAYLAAYLKKNSLSSHDIEIFDAEGLGVDFQTIEKKIREFCPIVVGITMTSSAYDSVKTILELTKKVQPSIFTLVGGAHPSAFPTQLLNEIPQIDFSIVGEGEIAFMKLINAIESDQKYKNVNGLVYKHNGEIIFNEDREYITDINSIPFPARDLLPMHVYFPSTAKSITHKGGFTNIFSSRGCPHNCTYCSSNNIWQRKVRLRSPQNVVDEMEECYVKYNITRFNFNDDIFPMNRKRTIEICQEIQRRNLDIRWTCMSRADFVWSDAMAEMKNAGCELINFGFESGSSVILKSINKKTTLDQGINAVKICHDAGLKVMGNFMIGNIGETTETIKDSIRYAKKLNLDSAGFFIAIPYPGTEFFTQATKNGYMREDWSYSDMVSIGEGNTPVELPNLSSLQLRRWQGRAMREFYLRPQFIFKILKRIRSIRDIRALGKGLHLFLDILTKIYVNSRRSCKK